MFQGVTRIRQTLFKNLFNVFFLAAVLFFIACGSETTYNTSSENSAVVAENNPPFSKGGVGGFSGEKGFKERQRAEYVPGEILVKFKPYAMAHTDSEVQRKVKYRGVSSEVKQTLKAINVHHLKITDPELTVEDAIKRLKEDPDVEYAEPNYILNAVATPDDPRFSDGTLWGLNNINATQAWSWTTGSSSVTIAVIDTGVTNHPDLNTNIGTGWTTIDYIDDDTDPTDPNGHGTHVAGTIAAVGNNSTGITGVMWSAKIMPLRFLGVSGSGNTADAVDAIEYAADNGARIINASWGGGGEQTLYDAINYAKSKNVLFVAAAGNDAYNNDISPFYPASYNLDNIISVAATDSNDNLAYFSNYGATSVDLAAPGVNIYSSIPTFGAAVTIHNQNFDAAFGNLPLQGWSHGVVNPIYRWSSWAWTSLTGITGNSMEDSPGRNYFPNTNSWAGWMTVINSVKNNRYTLSFMWKGNIESYYDYLNINYSLDGTSWDYIAWTYGNKSSWTTFTTTKYTDIAGHYNGFYFGFGLESDSTIEYDGAYIDDVSFYREPINTSGESYAYYDGTSMAAPHVSGVAGLILSVNSSLTYQQVKDLILNNVDQKSSLSGKTYTVGRLNAYNAVYAAQNFDSLSSAPSSLSASSASSSQINLTWTDSTNETGFKLERKTGSSGGYSQIATVGSDTTSYSDTGLSASTTYYYRVRSYNSYGNSSYSNEATAATSSSGGGGGGGGCFIATAAYGSYLAPEVKILQDFRDKYLITNSIGRIFVQFYYSVSPPIAEYISRHERLKTMTRVALTPLVYGLKYPFVALIFMGLFIMFILYRSKRSVLIDR